MKDIRILIDDEEILINDLTPFLLILRRLFYQDNTDQIVSNLSNLKNLIEELEKIRIIESKIGEIPSYSYMPVSYAELMEYMKENLISFEDLKGTSVDGIVRVAENMADLNEYEEALNFIELALRLKPEEPYPLMLKGSFLVEMGKIDDGMEYLERSIEKDPKLTTAYSLLGDIYYNKGNYEKASYYWEKELDISPESRFTYFMIADARKKMGDLVGAVKILEKLADRDKNDILARYELSELYRSLGNDEKAKKYEMEILNSKPFYSNDLEVWSKIQYKYGNYDKVREILEKKFDKDDPMVKLLLIVPYIKSGDIDMARKLLEDLKLTSSWYYYGKKEFLSEFFEKDELERVMKE